MSKHKRKVSLLLFCILFFCVSVQTHAQSAGKVTGYEKITWGISTGRYYVNGTHAFCAQYNKSWPLVGTEIQRIELCTNEVLRKALYYGYNGPANTLGTDDKAHVLTAIAVSDANIGERETGASSKYDVFYWDIVNNPSNYPTPPDNFKAYMAITTSEDLQNLAFYEVEKNGYVKAIKASSNPELTNENGCYSLQGAQYGLYSSASLSGDTKVGTLTIDAKGNSNTVELCAGTYYAYEVVAPKGYKKSEAITKFTVTSGETITLQFQDDPHTTSIDMLLQKVDKETGKQEAQGLATLQGAEFQVRFYAGLWEENVDPDTVGATPERVWTFRTDEKGEIHYAKEYQTAGDMLYEELPLGTITIRETKPSPGYLLNETVFIRRLTSKVVYASVVVEETYDKPDPYDLVIHKRDLYENHLSEAEFSLYADPTCEVEVAAGVTEEDGLLRLSGLEMGAIYYLKETKAPAGYRIATDAKGKSKVYEISAIYNPITEEFLCCIDGVTYPKEADERVTISETTEKREVHLNVINELGYQLPQTGSCTRLLITLTGIVLCSMSVYLTNKEKRRNEL